MKAGLSVRFGGLCAQRGIRCLQRLDLGLDLPFEIPPPCGELGLAENFEAIPSSRSSRLRWRAVALVARLLLRPQPVAGPSSLVGLALCLLGILWWLSERW